MVCPDALIVDLLVFVALRQRQVRERRDVPLGGMLQCFVGLRGWRVAIAADGLGGRRLSAAADFSALLDPFSEAASSSSSVLMLRSACWA